MDTINISMSVELNCSASFNDLQYLLFNVVNDSPTALIVRVVPLVEYHGRLLDTVQM